MRSKHDVWANLMSGQTSGDSIRSAMSSSADNQLSANPEADQRIDYKTLYEIAKADGELYSSLLNASTDPIVVYDTEGRVKYVNAGFTKLFGWSFKDLQGIRIPFVPESEASITMSWIDRLYRGGEPSVTFETKRYTKDGSLLDINISASCYRDARGTIAGMLVILRDITNQKRIMDALRFSEEKYRLVVDHARQVILVAQNGIIKFINPYAAQLVETSSDNIIGKPFLNFVHPDDREKTFGNYTARLQGSQIPERYHLRVLTASQKLKWVEVYGHLIDWEGQMADLVFISDVTERKLSEDALRQSEENYRSIFNGAEDAIFIHDVQTGAVLDVNDRVTELYGYSKEESINSDFSLFCAEDEGFTTDKAAKRLHQAAQGHSQSFEWRARAKDGHSFWVDVHLRLVTLEGHDRILASVRDITEKKKAEELLLNAELLKAVAELATGVSHNFNNILQRILACCQSAIIKLDVGDHIAARSLLTEILENSKNGSETVKRLQSFAQLRADVTSYTDQVFDLTTVVKDALGMTDLLSRTLAFKNGVSISIEAELIDGLMVSGISNDLFEVALNLMRNAIESVFENGVIKVRTYAQENSAILEVEDNGSGISLENLGKIFDPFFTTKGFQSTGMGLASAYGIVTSHGGSVSVNSKLGYGSTFTITIPLSVTDKDDIPQDELDLPIDSSLRFLVIDDDQMLLALFEEALTSLGQRVRTASSGEKALSLLQEEDFDVITCDLGMPHMNGWEVGKRIRKAFEQSVKSKPPLILLTGWGGQMSETDKMLESGIDSILEKPVDITELIAVASGLVSRK